MKFKRPEFMLHGHTITPGWRERPMKLCVSSLVPKESHAIGLLTRSETTDVTLWLLAMRRGSPSCDHVASLVALLLLDQEAGLLRTGFMPPRPAAAALYPDGSFRIGRRTSLPEWARNEISRISTKLKEDAPAYLDGIASALSGRPPEGFSRPTEGFYLTDDSGSTFIAPVPPRIAVDTPKALPWYQQLSIEYRNDRYLRHLNLEALGRRVADILGNAHVIDQRGLIALDPKDPLTFYWLGLLQEVTVEMALRFGPYPKGWEKLGLRDAALPASLARDRQLTPTPTSLTAPLPDGQLVKYGKRRYLLPMLTEGRVRVFPASSYNDSSLNFAVRDDELTATIESDPVTVGMWQVLRPGTASVTEIPFRATVTLSCSTDYYVFCMSSKLSARLQQDFAGDSCLVIREPAEFARRFDAAIREHLPCWQMEAFPVAYYDPLQVSAAEINIPSAKHFRFAYEHEVRVVWIPPAPLERLTELDITIGDLRDICELVEF